MKQWQLIPENNLEYIGILEFNISEGEHHYFEIMHNHEYLVFGSATNSGFSQSGYMLKDEFFSLDENLQELLEELECYYRDGREYCTEIVTNERM